MKINGAWLGGSILVFIIFIFQWAENVFDLYFKPNDASIVMTLMAFTAVAAMYLAFNNSKEVNNGTNKRKSLQNKQKPIPKNKQKR